MEQLGMHGLCAWKRGTGIVDIQGGKGFSSRVSDVLHESQREIVHWYIDMI